MPPSSLIPAAKASPVPVLDAEWMALLSGQAPLDRQLAREALMWLWQAAWSLMLIGVLAWIVVSLYDWMVTRFFRVLDQRLPDDAAHRLSQRLMTGAAIVRSVGKAGIVFIALTMALARLGVNVAPVLASAGIVGLAVGFGSQSLIKDVISGFFIIMEDQYGVGDVIEVSGQTGLVERMNLRITQLRNGQGALITLPNGQITTVVNHSKQWARAVVDVGVPLHVETSEALTALREAATGVAGRLKAEVLEAPDVQGIEGLKDDGYTVRVQFKTAPLQQWKVARAFREAVAAPLRTWHLSAPARAQAVRTAATAEPAAGPADQTG